MKKVQLSKSDYKVGADCITKLYYKKLRYPSSNDADPFMELLAEGGYMVGKLAQLLYPGHTIEKMETAVEETATFLQQKNVCLHEAIIVAGNKIIRVDILNKKNKVLELIEVKAKSWDCNEYSWETKKVVSDFDEYLEDVTFQYMVIKEAYPEFEIRPYLFLPDKAKRTKIEGLNGMFKIKKLPPTESGFRGYDIDFAGNVDEVMNDDIMTLVDVKEMVQNRLPQVEALSKVLIDSITPEPKKAQADIGINCKGCEYRVVKETKPNGFAECWGKKSFNAHHILDLTQLGNINRLKGVDIQDFINNGGATYKDLNAELFIDKYSNRPYYQVVGDKEVMLDGLKQSIEWDFPFCFIDFEVSKMALPYHKGMRPYENVAFQWSCHTLYEDGRLVHKDWINVIDTFPNFQFAESLMAHIKNAGSVLIWSSYENTILKDIYEQMDVYGYKNKALKEWLEEFVKFYKGDVHGFIDQAKIARDFYHHPHAKGKYGIKYILPSILLETKDKQIIKWLEELKLYHTTEDGKIGNPYDALPKLEIEGESVVRDGTGAIRAYQDMMYGIHKDNIQVKLLWEDALRQYCRLDTLAMVLIWKYWKDKDNNT